MAECLCQAAGYMNLRAALARCVKAVKRVVRIEKRGQCLVRGDQNAVRLSKINLPLGLCYCDVVLVGKRSNVRNTENWTPKSLSAAFLAGVTIT